MNSERDFSAAASSSAILDEKVLVATFDGLVTPEYRPFFFWFVCVFCLSSFLVFTRRMSPCDVNTPCKRLSGGCGLLSSSGPGL